MFEEQRMAMADSPTPVLELTTGSEATVKISLKPLALLILFILAAVDSCRILYVYNGVYKKFVRKFQFEFLPSNFSSVSKSQLDKRW